MKSDRRPQFLSRMANNDAMTLSCQRLTRFLILGAGFWLLVGLLLAVLKELQWFTPNLLQHWGMPGYGPLSILAETILDYGFAAQAAIAVTLRVQSARRILSNSPMGLIGCLFWNLGITLATWEILQGHNSGVQGFQLPMSSAVIMLIGLIAMGGCAALSKFKPDAVPPRIADWFATLALLSLGWILVTAVTFLFVVPARGIIQASCGWWLQHALHMQVIGFAGLAYISHYFESREKPLGSLALCSLALFGGFGGIPFDAPLPAWMVTLSAAGRMACIIPLLALILHWKQAHTTFSENAKRNFILTRFAAVTALFWVLVGSQSIIEALPPVSELTQYTQTETAANMLLILGFMAIPFLGIVAELFIPQQSQKPAIPRRLRVPFGCFCGGALLSWFSTTSTGIAQGILLKNPSNTIANIVDNLYSGLLLNEIGIVISFTGAALTLYLILSHFFSKLTPFPNPSASIKSLSLSHKDSFAPLTTAGLLLLTLVPWIFFIALPLVQLGSQTPASIVGNDLELYPQPRSALAIRGANIYRAQGCIACHTQQIRPATRGNDIIRGWGRRSVSRDYLYDSPPMPGKLRMGPDLANVGSRLDSQALRNHLTQFHKGNAKSPMSDYSFLFTNRTIFPTPTDGEALLAYLSSLQTGAILYETPTHSPLQ
jgi:hypothetical protein